MPGRDTKEGAAKDAPETTTAAPSSKKRRKGRGRRSVPAVIDAEVVERPDQEAAAPTSAPAKTADATASDTDPLAEAPVVSDEDLDALAAEVLAHRPHAAPEGTAALALRDPVSAYMAEARRYPLLTREQEYALAVKWVEEGDAEAAKALITSNLRLVVKIAYEYRNAHQSLLDLIQEGNVGLVKAVQKYDPYRNVRLSTYAAWWIRAYILKYILNNWRLVKLGTTQNQRKLFFNLRKQKAALEAAGIDPTPERIAKALDVSKEEVVEMERRMSGPDVSLDAKIRSDDEESRTRLDALADEGADPDRVVGDAEFRELLDAKLRAFGATLEGREAEIFRERLLAEDPITLQALGDRWGVSRERARQIEKRLLKRLRKYLQDELGEAVEVSLSE
ncbi:MAG: sigma-70 family RNA polymerase sigma factor [Deltaproteobacteria bacterium]|nr:MAG: sigma-70 family RNA polymerase sigma factor [Deltaproteobacteria bacterium]